MLRILLFVILGFIAGALLAYALVSATSSNNHDLSLELTMTSIFVGGPAGAVLGFAVALFHRRKP